MNNNSFENLLFESQQQFEDQLNQGFKEGVKKVGNFVKNNKGAISGGVVGAVLGGPTGAAVGVTTGVLHDKVRNAFKPGTDKKPATKKPATKKPVAKKKINQNIDTFDNFTQLDFHKFEDDYLQNQGGWDLDIDKEIDSLNESEIFTNDDFKVGTEFLNEVKKFQNSYEKLVFLWGESDIVHDLATDNYPFESSFDEYNIDDWVRSIDKNLKKIKNSK